MSADVIIICKEHKTGADYALVEKKEKSPKCEALFIDECSMGEPWTEFGKWFVDRFCGAPGLMEQLQGMTEHHFTEVKQVDIEAVETALNTMKSSADKEKVMKFMRDHLGKHISTENW